MTNEKSELTEYTLEDGAYGLYLSIDGYGVDVEIGSRFYSKQQADDRIKSLEKRIKKINKHLKDLRQKYKTLQQLRSDALGNCKQLLNTLEGKRG